MSFSLQFFLLACGILFCSIVLFLLLKYKINERNSVFWLSGVICILIISGNPKLLDRLAAILGIHYPPSLLFLLSTLVLLLFSLYQTIQITNLNNKLKDLSQYLALHHEEFNNAQYHSNQERRD